jgi:hypothetical protein
VTQGRDRQWVHRCMLDDQACRHRSARGGAFPRSTSSAIACLLIGCLIFIGSSLGNARPAVGQVPTEGIPLDFDGRPLPPIVPDRPQGEGTLPAPISASEGVGTFPSPLPSMPSTSRGDPYISEQPAIDPRITDPSIGEDPSFGTDSGIGADPVGGQSIPLGAKSLEILPRSSSVRPQVSTINRPGEMLLVARGGVTLEVRDATLQPGGPTAMALGTVSLSADNVVGWLPPISSLLRGELGANESIEAELYLEGNIVVRQGARLIYAERMYYNIAREYGVVLDAELLSPLEQFGGGFVRLKADVLQQLSREDFIGFGAAATTSRLGVPRYWLQSNQVAIRSRDVLPTDPVSGLPFAAPELARNDVSLTSRDNFVYIGGVPLLYWPKIATNLNQPSYYISGLKVRNDGIFGTQVQVDTDLYQLFGIENPPTGTEWSLSTDYFSQRGPALGTQFNYTRGDALGHVGPVSGQLDAWGIYDEGLDTLGLGRFNMQPEEDLRGRVRWRHRQQLANGFEFVGQGGLVSDRNFLEQYFEREWDWESDPVTSLALNKYDGNQLLSVTAQPRVNDFFTQTNHLPRLDYYFLGASIADTLTWSNRTQVGYAKQEVASTPLDPQDAATFALLPWESESEGIRAATRQELAFPVQLGGLKTVPFISGEAAHWGEDLTGQDLTRLTGQAGIRTSLPMWRIYPTVTSSLLNIRGLAHKLEWYGEAFYADSTQNFDQLPLYDPLDDDSQEHFRRRLRFNTFGGATPATFDERNFAFRQGIQRWVTSPTTEIADDLLQARLGLRQRWQTHRGLPGQERIVDLLRLDASLIVFPDADRDNFGETIGPAVYDARYNIGDRLALLSDGYFDFFNDGLRSISLGMQWSRPGLGDFYLGAISLEGPISSTIVNTSLDYRLDEKWIISGGTTFDFGEVGNVGQTIALTRVGESALIKLGVNVDSGRDNVGFVFMIEPRFWPRRRLGGLGGQLIPGPGSEGVE